MKQYLKFLRMINLKSIRFNLKYFPFNEAIKFPVLISKNMILMQLDGEISIVKPLRTGMIQIGYSYGGIGLFDKKKSRGIWQVTGKVIFKGTSRIGHGAKISVGKSGVVELGDNFALTAESAIVAKKRITFGENCLISWDCLFMDSDYHNIYDTNGDWINEPTEIQVGSGVWIGCRNLILKGSKIADCSIIGANSVVNKALEEPSSIYVGNPAKLIKNQVRWEA